MAGYIGSKSSVTLVDGYTEAEADAEFVTKTGDTMTGDLVVENSSGATINVNTGLAGAVSKVILHEGSTASPANGATLEYDGATNLFSIGVGSDISTKRLSIARDSGNVGIGTSSPSADFVVSNGGAAGIELQPEITTDTNRITNYDRAASAYMNFRLDGLTHQFLTSGTERMRIDSDGTVIVNRTAAIANDFPINIQAKSSGGIIIQPASNASFEAMRFVNHGLSAAIGNITCSTTSTAFNTSSDYRLKENVVDLTGASARVNQLDVKRFNFIADETNTLVDGFLAHEVATVVPEAITGTKDAMRDEEYEVTPATGDIYTPATDEVDEVIHSADAEQPETLEDGQQWRETTAAVMGTRSVPDHQGIDQSKLVPLLTAALQEALTEIASLKTRVQALEDV